MHEKLRSFLERQFPVTDEQFEFIKTLFIPKKVRKGEFLLREGEMARYSILLPQVVCALTPSTMAGKNTYFSFRRKIGGQGT